MRATKISIAINLGVAPLVLALMFASFIIENAYLQVIFSNGGLNLILIIVCPTMIALGLRDLSRLRKSTDFHSMASLPDAEREMRERIVSRVADKDRLPHHLGTSWESHRGKSLDRETNYLKPSKPARPVQVGWSQLWRRDSYITTGMANLQYLRIAWLVTAVYLLAAVMLFFSKTSIWMMLYWLVPLGIVVLWFWRFIIFQWIDLVRDVFHRDRKHLYREGSDEYIPSTEQLDTALNADPAPHRTLGMDWETYRRKREHKKYE